MPHALDRSKTFEVRIVRPGDWKVFQGWCATAGWIISEAERFLLQNRWRSCFKVLYENNLQRAFISVVRYSDSAWIGNLIVDPLRRGCGYGSLLFNTELEALDTAGLGRVWLTASAMGEPLYRKHGFGRIDTCERWIGTGVGQHARAGASSQVLQSIISDDTGAWGESRQELLEYLGSISAVVVSRKFTALVQPGTHTWHIGPWLGKDTCEDISADIGSFVAQIRKSAPGGQALSVDLLKASKLGPYLEQAGFRRAGISALMCRTCNQVDIGRVYALASLGSIG